MNNLIAFLQALAAVNAAILAGKLGTPAQIAQFKTIMGADAAMLKQVEALVTQLEAIHWNTTSVSTTSITPAQFAWLERTNNDLAAIVPGLKALAADLIQLNAAY